MAPSPEDIAWLVLLYIIVPGGWIVGLLCIRWRPRRLLAWTAVVAAFYFAFGIASRTGGYTLTIQVLDPERRPLPGVIANYFTHPQSDRFGRFSQPLEGDATTDAYGQIVLHPNHAHGFSFTIRDPRFHYASFRIEAAGVGYGHQMYPNDSVTFVAPNEPPPTTGPFPGSWVFDAQAEHRIVIALKPK